MGKFTAVLTLLTCVVASVDEDDGLLQGRKIQDEQTPGPCPQCEGCAGLQLECPSPTHDCPQGWLPGDGMTGGAGAGETMVGYANTQSECATMVKSAITTGACPAANGATYKESNGKCFCETGMYSWSTDVNYRTCPFYAFEADTSDDECTGGWQAGKYGIPSSGERKLAWSGGTRAQCIQLVKDECPDANGATFTSPGLAQECYCQTGQVGIRPHKDWQNCAFKPPTPAPTPAPTYRATTYPPPIRRRYTTYAPIRRRYQTTTTTEGPGDEGEDLLVEGNVTVTRTA